MRNKQKKIYASIILLLQIEQLRLCTDLKKAFHRADSTQTQQPVSERRFVQQRATLKQELPAAVIQVDAFGLDRIVHIPQTSNMNQRREIYS